MASCASNRAARTVDEIRGQDAQPPLVQSDLFSPEAEKQIAIAQDELLPMIRKLQVTEQGLGMLRSYLPKIDSSLPGMNIRDTLLMRIGPEHDFDLRRLIIDYVAEADPQNRTDLEQLVSLRDQRANLSYEGFGFSTDLYRLRIDPNFTMLLPKSNWKGLPINKCSHATYAAGSESDMGMITLAKRTITPEYDIFKNARSLDKVHIVLTNSPEEKQGGILKFDSGPLVIRAKDVKIGLSRFKAIYDSVAIAPNEGEFQTLVDRTRYYLTDQKMVSISIVSMLPLKHMLADRARLADLFGKLLDSVYFVRQM